MLHKVSSVTANLLPQTTHNRGEIKSNNRLQKLIIVFFVYVVIAALFFVIIHYSNQLLPLWGSLVVNTGVLLMFVAHIIYHDLPLKSLPVIGKYFK